MSGTLYGVGVGPGDPELMTVKAWRLISTAKVLAYFAANGGQSTARTIASSFIDPSTDEISIDMPMRAERGPARAAYDEGAKTIAERLARGQDVVMLCEGDPLFYGSFMYVFERLSPKFRTTVIPGVTSISASAAELGQALCERDESFKVLPATMSEESLRRELRGTKAAAILKIGRHFGKVKRVLESLSLTPHAAAVVKATHDDQAIIRNLDIPKDALPYFTTIIVRTPKE